MACAAVAQAAFVSPVNVRVCVHPSPFVTCPLSPAERSRGKWCVLRARGVFVLNGSWHPGVFPRLIVASGCRRGLCGVIVCQCVLRKKCCL